MKPAYAFLAALLIASVAAAQTSPEARTAKIVVDHNSVALFERIPDQYLAAAQRMKMMFADKSVGQNISEGLDCLSRPSSSVAPNACRRWGANPPENWSRSYPRTNWVYYWFPGQAGTPNPLPCTNYRGNWQTMGACFDQFMRSDAARYEVWGYQTTYLEVMPGSTIAERFFSEQPNAYDATDYLALQRAFPEKHIVWWTSSLARAIGSPESELFNMRMREFAAEHGGILFDAADIESHRQDGTPCTNSAGLAVICADYTTERNGGHLGSVSQGKIRLAKAMWVLMARIAGWQP